MLKNSYILQAWQHLTLAYFIANGWTVPDFQLAIIMPPNCSHALIVRVSVRILCC